MGFLALECKINKSWVIKIPGPGIVSHGLKVLFHSGAVISQILRLGNFYFRVWIFTNHKVVNFSQILPTESYNYGVVNFLFPGNEF